MKLKTTVFMLAALLVHVVCGQTLTPKSITLYKTDILEAPQSSCDYFPFLKMDMSASTNTFLLAFCEYDIEWSSTTNEKESIEHDFTTLTLINTAGTSLSPIGEFTADQRLKLINNPKYSRVQAQEKWGATGVRFGALFLVDRNEEKFTLSFAGTKHEVTATTDPLPNPADLAKITILESKLADSVGIERDSRLNRTLPGVKTSLSASAGKLLQVKIDVCPQAPNVMGGEMRYVYRPSDFMLISDGQTQRPLGFLSSNFGMDTIYNLSRTSLEELQKIHSEITLVFAVGTSYKSGELIFLDQCQGMVTVE